MAQFSARMCHYFYQWVTLAKTEKTYESVCDLMLRENVIRKCKVDVRLFLKERIPKSLKETIKLTEQYVAAHGGSFWWVKNKPKHDHEASISSEHTASQRPQNTKIQDRVMKQCFLCH